MARDTLPAADGRWPEILAHLAGLSAEQLTPSTREIPCPHCGGTDRYRWISDAGPGRWHCSHCGGAKGQGGYDRGIGLLCRVTSWPFDRAAREVEQFLGVPQGSAGPAGFRPPRRTPRRAPTEREAFAYLDAAGELADGELFCPSRARGRAYSRRWLRWSEANVEAAAAILQEAETIAGADAPPDPEPEPQAEPGPSAGGQGAPLTMEQVAAELRALVSAGATQLELQQQLVTLATRADSSPAQLRPLLVAIEAEQAATEQVAAERQRFANASDRSAVARQLLALTEILPPSLAQAVELRTQYLPIDSLSAAGLLLTAAAGVLKIGTELVASRRVDFRVPLNLFSAVVGRSGIKKSPAWKALVRAPLAPIEQDLARQAARALEAWQQQNQGKKAAERTDRPRTPRALVSDFTGEALAGQLAIQERDGLALLIAREELGGLFGSLNQYRQGQGGDQQQLLELYDGGGSSSLRVSADDGGRFFARSHVSIVGTIQPKVLRALVADDDGAGLWARFLFLPVPDEVVPLPAEESDEDAEAMEAAAALLAHTIGALYRLPRVSLALDDQSRAVFMAYELRCQHDAKRAALDTHAAAWSKAPGKALRVAGILHLLHRVCPDGNHSETVGAATMQTAQNIVDSLTEYALGIHADAESGAAATGLMERIHRLASSRGTAVTWRDVHATLSRPARRETDAAAGAAAVAALVAMGVGTSEEGSRRGSWRYCATGDLPG